MLSQRSFQRTDDLVLDFLKVGGSVSVLDFLHVGGKDCFCDFHCDTLRCFGDYTLCFCDLMRLFLSVLSEHNGLEGARARWRQFGASPSIPILNIFATEHLGVRVELRLRGQARPGVFRQDAPTCLLLRRGASRAGRTAFAGPVGARRGAVLGGLRAGLAGSS